MGNRLMRYVPELVNRIKMYPKVAVFGARIVAREVAGLLMDEPYDVGISCFIVFDLNDNPESIMGIPVLKVEDAPDDLKDGLVIIASMEKSLNGITDGLYRKGFFNILPLTFESDIWSELRGNAYATWFEDVIGKPYRDIDDETANSTESLDELHLYRAVSIYDRILYEKDQDYSWEMPIQVGKLLTDKTICDLNDALGTDNISEKNARFCELTALYWIWKNDSSRYKGLCHYRRHFMLDENKRRILTGSDIDVVLTIPVFNEPDVYTVYSEDHEEADWKIMMEELERHAPDYVETAERLAKGNWYYAYNMFIAKEEVFNDYCSFLFPILFACEKRIGNKDDKYQNRYAGFLSERLMTVYFMKHTEYKIVHCRKHFVSY